MGVHALATITYVLYLIFFRTALKGTVILLPLMGITWIVGIFAVSQNTLVFAWIFTILNSLQVKRIIIDEV